MGNQFRRMALEQPQEVKRSAKNYEPIETFKFLGAFPDETNNGLYLNDVYLPEEVVMMILSYIEPKQLLNVSAVCKKWCNIIKSHSFWAQIYQRQYGKKAEKLPWYVYFCLLSTDYFDKNLIKNGNGQEQFKHWKITRNYGDAFRIENPPCGSDHLPPDVPEFNGETSCFATSYYECNKLQEISLENNRLMQIILNQYKPHIYLSEWVAGRFDCGCIYNLWCKLYPARGEKSNIKKMGRHDSNSDFGFEDDNTSDEESENQALHIKATGTKVEQWEGSKWSKVEMLVDNYPAGVQRILFQHEGKDTQFWKGHYGSKMAGGVLKILFDTIEPLE